MMPPYKQASIAAFASKPPLSPDYRSFNFRDGKQKCFLNIERVINAKSAVARNIWNFLQPDVRVWELCSPFPGILKESIESFHEPLAADFVRLDFRKL